MISVCLAAYNGEKFIQEQIESILNQLDGSDELIISDNGSKDKTINIISNIGDQRIKLIHSKRTNSKTGSINNNFHNSISLAQGDIILLSDQDDVWLPGKVKLFREQLYLNDLVLSDCIVVDSNLNTVRKSYFNDKELKLSFISTIIKNPFLGCCMGFKRSLLKEFGEIPKSRFVAHDIWIGLNAFNKRNSIGVINQPLLLYRKHEESVTSSGLKSQNNILYKIYYRLVIIVHLIIWKTRRFFN